MTTRLNKLSGIVVLLAALAGPAWWLAVTVPREGWNFPNDDAWIHQVFARNIARFGSFAFNAGEPSVGVTSPPWTLLLAGVHFLRLPVVPATLALGIAAHLLWVFAVYALLRTAWPEAEGKWWSAAGAVLFAAFGPAAWYALSGMETPLFFALGTWAIVLYAKRRYGVAGAAAAAAVAVRPEGALVFVMLVGLRAGALIKERRGPSAGEWFGFIVCPLAFILPFVIRNVAVAGEPLPSTFAGRRWFYTGEAGATGPVFWDGPPVLAFYWYRFIDFYTFSLDAVSSFIKTGATPFLLAQLGVWAMVAALARRRLPVGLGLFLVWVPLHNLTYAFALPNFGTAGRYEAVNYALFAVGAAFGARLLKDWVKAPGFKPVPYVLLAAGLVAAGASNWTWRGLYADNIYHITHVHADAGKWVDVNLPRDARVAAFDIGAFGYFANRYIVDIGGLIDPATTSYLKRRAVNEYLRSRKVDYVQVMEYDRADYKSIGLRIGLYMYDRHDYILEPVRTWELPRERSEYLGVTAIAYPKMTLYRLNWLGN